MSEQYLIAISNFGQSITIFVTLVAYIPQWRTFYKNKSSENISVKSWLLWLLTCMLAVFYAFVQVKVHHTGHALLVSSSVSLIFVATTIVLILRFRPARQVEREASEQGIDLQLSSLSCNDETVQVLNQVACKSERQETEEFRESRVA